MAAHVERVDELHSPSFTSISLNPVVDVTKNDSSSMSTDARGSYVSHKAVTSPMMVPGVPMFNINPGIHSNPGILSAPQGLTTCAPTIGIVSPMPHLPRAVNSPMLSPPEMIATDFRNSCTELQVTKERKKRERSLEHKTRSSSLDREIERVRQSISNQSKRSYVSSPSTIPYGAPISRLVFPEKKGGYAQYQSNLPAYRDGDDVKEILIPDGDYGDCMSHRCRTLLNQPPCNIMCDGVLSLLGKSESQRSTSGFYPRSRLHQSDSTPSNLIDIRRILSSESYPSGGPRIGMGLPQRLVQVPNPNDRYPSSQYGSRTDISNISRTTDDKVLTDINQNDRYPSLQYGNRTDDKVMTDIPVPGLTMPLRSELSHGMRFPDLITRSQLTRSLSPPSQLEKGHPSTPSHGYQRDESHPRLSMSEAPVEILNPLTHSPHSNSISESFNKNIPNTFQYLEERVKLLESLLREVSPRRLPQPPPLSPLQEMEERRLEHRVQDLEARMTGPSPSLRILSARCHSVPDMEEDYLSIALRRDNYPNGPPGLLRSPKNHGIIPQPPLPTHKSNPPSTNGIQRFQQPLLPTTPEGSVYRRYQQLFGSSNDQQKRAQESFLRLSKLLQPHFDHAAGGSKSSDAPGSSINKRSLSWGPMGQHDSREEESTSIVDTREPDHQHPYQLSDEGSTQSDASRSHDYFSLKNMPTIEKSHNPTQRFLSSKESKNASQENSANERTIKNMKPERDEDEDLRDLPVLNSAYGLVDELEHNFLKALQVINMTKMSSHLLDGIPDADDVSNTFLRRLSQDGNDSDTESQRFADEIYSHRDLVVDTHRSDHLEDSVTTTWSGWPSTLPSGKRVQLTSRTQSAGTETPRTPRFRRPQLRLLLNPDGVRRGHYPRYDPNIPSIRGHVKKTESVRNEKPESVTERTRLKKYIEQIEKQMENLTTPRLDLEPNDLSVLLQRRQKCIQREKMLDSLKIMVQASLEDRGRV